MSTENAEHKKGVSLFKSLKISSLFTDFIAYFGIQPVPFEFENANKVLRLGKKYQKLGKYRPFLDWEAACIRL